MKQTSLLKQHRGFIFIYKAAVCVDLSLDIENNLESVVRVRLKSFNDWA